MGGLVLYIAKPNFPRRLRWFFRVWSTGDRRYVAWGVGPRVLRANWPLRIDKR